VSEAEAATRRGDDAGLWSSFVRRLVFILVVCAVACVSGTALANDSIYRDPRRPSFTLLVPDGWTAEKTEQGVRLKRGTGFVGVWVRPGGASPGAILVQLRPQFERQYKNFRELQSGQMMLGGHKGAYAVYAGIPPSGVETVTRVATMTDGRLTYSLFTEAHTDELSRLKPDLDRIEASFAIEDTK
jgi:hypothetical protein